jgi:hypothetical protein
MYFMKYAGKIGPMCSYFLEHIWLYRTAKAVSNLSLLPVLLGAFINAKHGGDVFLRNGS